MAEPIDGELLRDVAAHLEAIGAPSPGDRVVVAVSGGIDSLVLLHLLRFGPGLPELELVAAHFDHRMRPDSGSDAAWLRGLLRAWGVPGRFGRAGEPLSDEAGARRARYAFLERARREEGADWTITGHHADDQAETILFRALRGTGLRGLRGILPRRDPALLRPLLSLSKARLVAYGEARGLRPRLDASNVDPRFARNVIRHELLPRAEEAVAPGAREALGRLARLAARNEEAWQSLVPELLEAVTPPGAGPPERTPLVLDREALLARHPAVRARLLRSLLRGLGVTLDEAGTREAVEFTRSGASGRRIELPEGLVLAREFDRLVVRRAQEAGAEDTLELAGAGTGGGDVNVGGRVLRARWSVGGEPAGAWIEGFSPSRLRFPLRLRAWEPGDRIRFSYGSKKLKKLFQERRVPLSERQRWPVLADADGQVLWLPGLARSTLAVPGPDEEPLHIGVQDADHL